MASAVGRVGVPVKRSATAVTGTAKVRAFGTAQVSAELVIPVQKSRETEETIGDGAEEILHPSRRVAAIVGAVMFLVVVVAVVAFVIRTNTSSTDDSEAGPAVNVVTSSTVTDQVGTPQVSESVAGNPAAVVAGSAPASAPASAPPSAPPSVAPSGPVTDILLQGTVRLGVTSGQPQDAFDFDLAMKADPKQSANWEPDVLAEDTGFTGMNGTTFAPWTQSGKPTHSGCTAVSAAQWETTIPLATLLPGSKWCARTSSERVAAFTVSNGSSVPDGALYSTYLDFTTWKKAVE